MFGNSNVYHNFFIFDIPKYYFVGELSSNMLVNCFQFYLVNGLRNTSVNCLVGELSQNQFNRFAFLTFFRKAPCINLINVKASTARDAQSTS